MQARLLATTWIGALLAGCSSPGEKLVVVEGRVTVNGNAVGTGHVGFIPDESKGTAHPEYSVGDLRPDGKFTLATNAKGGVRPGWYKVVVWASAEPLPENPVYDANGQLKPVRWLVNVKYTAKETTDLRVEVVEKPAAGAYEFDLLPP